MRFHEYRVFKSSKNWEVWLVSILTDKKKELMFTSYSEENTKNHCKKINRRERNMEGITKEYGGKEKSTSNRYPST